MGCRGARKERGVCGLRKDTVWTSDDIFSKIEAIAAHHAEISEPSPIAEAIGAEDIGAVFAAGSQTRALPDDVLRIRKENLEVTSGVVAPTVWPATQSLNEVGTPADVWAAVGVGYLLTGAVREADIFEIYSSFHANWTEISVSTRGAV